MATIELNQHNAPGMIAGIIFLIAAYMFAGIWIFSHEGSVVMEEGDPGPGLLWIGCSIAFWLVSAVLGIIFVVAIVCAVTMPFTD